MKGFIVVFFFNLLNILRLHNALEPEAIIGGSATQPNEIKYQVSVQLINGWPLCGGGIIGEEFVITAAHCTIHEKYGLYPLMIEAGTNDLNRTTNSTVRIEVLESYIAPNYNVTIGKGVGDIAILRLKSKLNLGPDSSLTKLNLPQSTENGLNSNNSYENRAALIAGFGWNQIFIKRVAVGHFFDLQEDGTSSGKMKKAKELIISNFDCNRYYQYGINDTQLCAKTVNHPSGHQGVCSGDSGSPLVINNTVVGLLSQSFIGCHDHDRPSTYTRVSAYINFIETITKNSK